MFCIHKIIGSTPITSKHKNNITLNNYYKVKPSRLNLYNKYVSRFDYLDSKSNLNSFINFDYLLVQTGGDFLSIKNTSLKISLLLEILTQQRIKILNSKKKKLKKFNYINVCLGKNKKWWVLDVYINSIFLTKLNNLNIIYEKVLNRLHFFITSKLITNLNLFNITKLWIKLKVKKLAKAVYWLPN